MISAWQSLTVSPLRLSSSPLTQRFPGRTKHETHPVSKKTTVKGHLVQQWPCSFWAFWQCTPLSTELWIRLPDQSYYILILWQFLILFVSTPALLHRWCTKRCGMDIPVPRLTTVPRPSPLLMTMVAKILRPRRLCWMRVVRALKRWWLNIAIWSCKVLPLTGS